MSRTRRAVGRKGESVVCYDRQSATLDACTTVAAACVLAQKKASFPQGLVLKTLVESEVQ